MSKQNLKQSASVKSDVANNWTYTVKPGEGLMAIVRKEFKLASPKDDNEIHRLVDLIVTHTPGISRDKIDVGDVLRMKGGGNKPPGKGKTYTVRSGDTLNGIVMREFKLSNPNDITRKANFIAAQNGIRNVNKINVGDVLKLS